jgi:hypothetical protein
VLFVTLGAVQFLINTIVIQGLRHIVPFVAQGKSQMGQHPFFERWHHFSDDVGCCPVHGNSKKIHSVPLRTAAMRSIELFNLG